MQKISFIFQSGLAPEQLWQKILEAVSMKHIRFYYDSNGVLEIQFNDTTLKLSNLTLAEQDSIKIAIRSLPEYASG